MKYIITDQNEIALGENTYHANLAETCKGKVVRAGHCKVNEQGEYEVFGESIGYGIRSKPEDAAILNNTFKYVKN